MCTNLTAIWHDVTCAIGVSFEQDKGYTNAISIYSIFIILIFSKKIHILSRVILN